MKEIPNVISTKSVEESILLSTKKSLGLDPSSTNFDLDIIVCINSALNILTQIGVGPVEGFSITSDEETWDDFIGSDKRLNMTKSYIYLKTKIIFDPPTGNALLEGYKEIIKEFECRLSYHVDPEDTFDGGESYVLWK